MKKIFMVLLAIFSLSVLASDKIGVIKERNSDRKIEMYKDNNILKFVLSDNHQSKVLSTLEVTLESNYKELTVETDKRNFYKFNIMKKMNRASDATIKFCWEGDEPAVGAASILAPVTTIPLCVVSHAAPYLLGVILSPVDAVLTVGDRFFYSEVIAARKFKKLIRGKNKKANSKVFNSLVRQIKEL